MRLLLFLLLVGVAFIGIEKPTEAQNYPWCAYYSTGDDGGGTNCGFTTFEQCMETARGLGSMCQRNTQYVTPPGPHPYTRQRRYLH